MSHLCLQDLAAAVDPTGIADIVQSFAAEDCGPLKVEANPEDGLVEDGDLKDSPPTKIPKNMIQRRCKHSFARKKVLKFPQISSPEDAQKS